jgi:protein-tyrosine-phosphatase
MAEAFFNKFAKGKARAVSAGTEPAAKVNSVVKKVMSEVGINLSRKKPKKLSIELLQSADKAVSMGCGVSASCPAAIVPMEDWELDDPEGKPIEEVRKIRDQIYKNVINVISRI